MLELLDLMLLQIIVLPINIIFKQICFYDSLLNTLSLLISWAILFCHSKIQITGVLLSSFAAYIAPFFDVSIYLNFFC